MLRTCASAASGWPSIRGTWPRPTRNALELASFLKIDLIWCRPAQRAPTWCSWRRRRSTAQHHRREGRTREHISCSVGRWREPVPGLLVRQAGARHRPDRAARSGGHHPAHQPRAQTRPPRPRSRRCSSARRQPVVQPAALHQLLGLRPELEISSFRHAVMILGLKKLFRWAALLLTTSRAGGVPPAVGMTAIVRGRLMELLAAELLPPRRPTTPSSPACSRCSTPCWAYAHGPGPGGDYLAAEVGGQPRCCCATVGAGPVLELTIACGTGRRGLCPQHLLALSNHQAELGPPARAGLGRIAARTE